MEYKTCSRCGRELPANPIYFSRSNYIKSGLRSECKECQKSLAKQEHSKNAMRYKECTKAWRLRSKGQRSPESIQKEKEYKKSYYQANKERLSELDRKRRAQNQEQIKEYRQKNKEHRAAIMKAWYQNNIEHVKKCNREWRRLNPDRINALNQKRRTIKIELPANYSVEQWNLTKQYFNNKCAYCGQEKMLTQDHFIALTNGGEYTINNIVPACINCNSSKRNKDFFEWYPKHKHYSKKREGKILKFLDYNGENQQLKLTI